MPNVSPLFLDKISLTYDFEESEDRSRERSELTASIDTWSASAGMSIGRSVNYYQGRPYRNNWRLTLSERTTSHVLLMTDPGNRFRGAAYFCIEWNPRHFTNEEHAAFWRALRFNLGEYYRDFLSRAVVTRIDFAVDVCPLNLEAVWVNGKNLHRSRIIIGRRGEVEEIQTIYLGARGSATLFCIYNRDSIENPDSNPSNPTTRFEARLKPRCSLRDLQSIAIKNPFGRLSVVNCVDPVTLTHLDDRYKLFLDSCWRRGLAGALRLFRRQATRRNYENWITENRQTQWFDAINIWEGYGDAIRRLGLDGLFGPPLYRYVSGRRLRNRQR